MRWLINSLTILSALLFVGAVAVWFFVPARILSAHAWAASGSVAEVAVQGGTVHFGWDRAADLATSEWVGEPLTVPPVLVYR